MMVAAGKMVVVMMMVGKMMVLMMRESSQAPAEASRLPRLPLCLSVSPSLSLSLSLSQLLRSGQGHNRWSDLKRGEGGVRQKVQGINGQSGRVTWGRRSNGGQLQPKRGVAVGDRGSWGVASKRG
eukprot:2228988-Rhodomonas_salina.3